MDSPCHRLRDVEGEAGIGLGFGVIIVGGEFLSVLLEKGEAAGDLSVDEPLFIGGGIDGGFNAALCELHG